MANIAVRNPCALNAITVAEVFYNIRHGFWFNLVSMLATQPTGFGLAGLCRQFLVWPASMVWPHNLIACTLLNAPHAKDDSEANGLSRYWSLRAGLPDRWRLQHPAWLEPRSTSMLPDSRDPA